MELAKLYKINSVSLWLDFLSIILFVIAVIIAGLGIVYMNNTGDKLMLYASLFYALLMSIVAFISMIIFIVTNIMISRQKKNA